MITQKAYYLDTNIILDNFENLLILSDEGENVIVLSRTVLSEIDSKKTLEGSIGYNAREFFRLMEKTQIITKSDMENDAKRIILKYSEAPLEVEIHLVSLNHFDANENNTDPKNLNDQRIIETAKKIKFDYENFHVLSNDIAFRSNAILDDLECESFKSDNKKVSELNLYRSYNVSEDIVFPLSLEEFAKLDEEDVNNMCGVELIYPNGNKAYGFREGVYFYEVSDDDLRKQIITPINMRQKILSSMIISDTNDIVVATGRAGTGKTINVLSGCCYLLDKKGSPYEGIIYIRNNIDSIEHKEQELGFLPGSAEEKLAPYLRPLKDSIDTLARAKYKVAISRNKEALNEKIDEFNSKYNIGFEAINFLRGGTIKNSLIIIDESQNLTLSAMKLIITRVGENCKVFILGDTHQIDSKYLNERNNGLTYMMNLVGTQEDIRIVGVDLTKTIRSKIAGWAADNM